MCHTTTKSIISEQNTMTVSPILKGAYHLEIYDSIEKAAQKWSLLAPTNNDFLGISYFQFLEENPPKGLSFRYLVFCQSEKVIGIAVCQLVQLRIKEALSNIDLPAYQQKVNGWILQLANMNAVIAGNLLLTGDYGSEFDPSIGDSLQFKLLEEGLEQLNKQLKKQNHLTCLLYTSPSPRDATLSRMPSSA